MKTLAELKAEISETNKKAIALQLKIEQQLKNK